MRHKNFIFRRLKISIKINPKRNDESSFQLKSFSMPKIRGFFSQVIAIKIISSL